MTKWKKGAEQSQISEKERQIKKRGGLSETKKREGSQQEMGARQKDDESNGALAGRTMQKKGGRRR